MSSSTTVNGVKTQTMEYTYDNNGSQLTSVMTPYVNGVAGTIQKTENGYDKLNQLITTKITNGTTVINDITNNYNGEGLRVSRVSGVSNKTMMKFLYEGDKVIYEKDDVAFTSRNVYGTNLISRIIGQTKGYYMHNGHADVTSIIGQDGKAMLASYYYDEFGNLTSSTGTFNNSNTYAGYQYDKETKTYYLMSRMYDPDTARFLQEDTYRGDPSDPLSLNLYTYCANNPLIYYDPTGHSFISDAWSGISKRASVFGESIKGGFEVLTNKKEREEVAEFIATDDNSISGKVLLTILATSDFIDDPVALLSENNQTTYKPFVKDTLEIKENSLAYKGIKYAGVRTESTIATITNTGKGIVQGVGFLAKTIYDEGKYAVNPSDKNLFALGEDGDKWSSLPGAMFNDAKSASDINKKIAYLFNPNMSLQDAYDYEQSVVNTALTVAGGYAIASAGIKAGVAVSKSLKIAAGDSSSILSQMMSPVKKGHIKLDLGFSGDATEVMAKASTGVGESRNLPVVYDGEFAAWQKSLEPKSLIQTDYIVTLDGQVIKNVATPYKRPSYSVTKSQRDSVQGKPCVTCGIDDGGKRIADYKLPIFGEYYGTGSIDKVKMRDVESVQPQCPTCSSQQGSFLSDLSKKTKKWLGFK